VHYAARSGKFLKHACRQLRGVSRQVCIAEYADPCHGCNDTPALGVNALPGSPAS
jgi:hypothetical protein